MKKIIAILLFLLLFLSLSCLRIKPALAVCDDPSGVSAPLCSANEFPCRAGGWNYCCDTQQECLDKQNNPTGLVTPIPSPTQTPVCLTPQLVPTAIGPIDVCNVNSLTSSILKFGIGIGGGIAFILMLAAVFMIMTSAGDPKRMQAGQELITSALMGLLLIIFSVFLLHFIGVDILTIPGFSK